MVSRPGDGLQGGICSGVIKTQMPPPKGRAESCHDPTLKSSISPHPEPKPLPHPPTASRGQAGEGRGGDVGQECRAGQSRSSWLQQDSFRAQEEQAAGSKEPHGRTLELILSLGHAHTDCLHCSPPCCSHHARPGPAWRAETGPTPHTPSAVLSDS